MTELLAFIYFITMQLLLRQTMKIPVRPVVASSMLEVFNVARVKPLWLAGYYLLYYFWLGVDHYCVETVWRTKTSAVVTR